MCKFNHLSVGQHLMMSDSGNNSCDGCGTYNNSGNQEMIYLGHSIVPRYGVCDTLQYVKPLECQECGMIITQWLSVCEGGFSVPSRDEYAYIGSGGKDAKRRY